MTSTTKLFKRCRSQAVRLPKEFRIPGTEVRVSKVGNKVILEPIEVPAFDVDEWRARLNAMWAESFLPAGLPEDPPPAPHEVCLIDPEIE